MSQEGKRPPTAESETGLQALKALLRERSLLPTLEIMYAEVGDIFQVTLPSFKPVFVAGPVYNRQVLVEQRDRFLWRSESDPVTRLLGHGLLVEDGEKHDHYRGLMEPALHRKHIYGHVEAMIRDTNEIIYGWQDGGDYDMLVEMRKVALLILMDTMFGIDFRDDMQRLWQPILKAIKYISPGPWIIWPDIPRPGYKKALGELDAFLFDVIKQRRQEGEQGPPDLLTRLMDSDLSDKLIRDQMLTMIIAGHDTSTALLSWALFLLGQHQDIMSTARQEVDDVLAGRWPATENLGELRYLDQVIKEALRLYPPIHVGNRIAAGDLQLGEHTIPDGSRVMYSIYLTHRDPDQWSEPEKFDPGRFDLSERANRPALSYVPFGGGPRNCIGAAFAQIESKIVLARILQTAELHLLAQPIKPYMGATLEPSPGVMMRVNLR